jgi:hypothetical protein
MGGHAFGLTGWHEDFGTQNLARFSDMDFLRGIKTKTALFTMRLSLDGPRTALAVPRAGSVPGKAWLRLGPADLRCSSVTPLD